MMCAHICSDKKVNFAISFISVSIHNKKMALILDEDAMEALITSRAVCYNDCGASCSDLTSVARQSSTCTSISSNSSATSPLVLNRSVSTGAISQYSTPLRSRQASSRKKCMIMADNDKAIYNSLGSSSSPSGKVI